MGALLTRVAGATLVVLLGACGGVATGASVAIRSEYGTPVALAPSVSLDQPVPPRPTQRVLAVAWHHQQHRLSCEAAALRMALSYVGVNLDELTLMSYMGYDGRPARFDAHGHLVTWGDPNAAYVGNPDGNIYRFTGYGVYYAPVARAVVRAGIHVIVAGSGLYGLPVSPQVVYDSVLDGHPVVVWISNTYKQVPLSTYVGYDGARVEYTLTEHAVTIIGVRPGAVLINDPWYGQAWHTKAQFESAYATFKQMAVILGS